MTVWAVATTHAAEELAGADRVFASLAEAVDALGAARGSDARRSAAT
jgi:hypothetical protein